MGTVLFVACYGKKPEHTGKEGLLLPSFSILLPDSMTWINTNTIKPGKPMVFLFFGPHCSFSKAQMQDIIDNAGKLKSIQFYAITPFPFHQMKEFYETYNLKDYSNIITGIDPYNFFGNYMEVRAVPYIAIYAKDKKLVKAFRGKIDISELEEAALDYK